MSCPQRQNDGFGQTALQLMPVIRLSSQFIHRPLTKKSGITSVFVGCFRSNRLGSIFAKLGLGSMTVGIRPGATRAIESVLLVQAKPRGYRPTHAGFPQGMLQGVRDRWHTGGGSSRVTPPQIAQLLRVFRRSLIERLILLPSHDSQEIAKAGKLNPNPFSSKINPYPSDRHVGVSK